MKAPLILFAAIFAASNASLVPFKRQTANKIVDGGFEDVPDDYELQTNVDAGGWSFRKRCTMDFNIHGPGGCPPDTIYGDKYAIFWNFHKIESRGTVSQHVTGLTGGAHTLKYAWRLEWTQEAICTFSVKFGSQMIDSFPIPIGDTRCEVGPWKTRTKSFTPAQSSGDLTFEVYCPHSHGYWRIYMDNVSLTGPN